MFLVIAVSEPALAATAGCRKKGERDDRRWSDRLEERDAVLEDN